MFDQQRQSVRAAALWFDGSQGAITGPINVTNDLIEQSPFEAVQWVEGTVSGVSLSNVTIACTSTFALQEQVGVPGLDQLT